MTLAIARLLQLASPLLPVGAYTYSQGLEWAVESGGVRDAATAWQWISGVLEEPLGRFEAPLTARVQHAWETGELGEVQRLNADFVASRETSELRAETLQMGYSLHRLWLDLSEPALPAARHEFPEMAFPTAWALLAASWRIASEASLTGYLWSWCENQVVAAMKTVPLGQTAGQRLLLACGDRLPAIVERALALPENEWSTSAPGLAIASSRHETQYARLFRS